MFDRKVTMSGVVSPVDTLSFDVVTPACRSTPRDARHAPQLARHFDRRGLAVGAGHRDAGRRKAARRSAPRAARRLARIGVGDMCTAPDDLRLGPRDDRDRARFDRRGMKSSPLNFSPSKAPKIGAGRDLAMIDREPGHDRVGASRLIGRAARTSASFGARFPSRAAGSVRTRRRRGFRRGITPSIGPVRAITTAIRPVPRSRRRW
jgi:hypothetical protein